MSKRKAPPITEKEVALESVPSSRPWTGSTATTANVFENDKTRLSAPQQAALARAKSEAWRSRSQRRYSIESRNQASRRSSYAGRSGRSLTREVSPMNMTASPSVTSISPSTTVCPTPQMLLQRPTQPVQTPRKQPNLTIQIPNSDDDLHADLHWQINAQNPKNWNAFKKWLHTIVPCALAWVFALGSSIVTPAHDSMMRRLHTSSTVVVLTLSLYVLGLAFGPYLSALGSEVFGRKNVYMICVPLYAVFMLASGLVQVLPGLLLCRFLAGVSCSPALHMGWSTIGDLWSPDDKVLPLTIYVSSTFLGSTLGPVLGAYLIWEENWRWTQYVVLCALGGCMLPVMAMHETSKKAILRRKRDEPARAPIDRNILTLIFVKPLKMLFLEPIVLLYALYAAFNYGVLYAVYTAFPTVLAQAEHFDRGHQGLSFLGMGVGVIIGLILLTLYENLIHCPRVARYKETHSTEEEKTLQTGRRASRLSLARPSQEQIHMSKVTSPSDGRGRRSLLTILRRVSTTGYKNLDQPQIDPQRNLNLAVAAAKYINTIEGNEGKHIMPERILLLLNQNLEFAHLCIALEGFKLKFDRVDLARVLYTALQDHATNGIPTPEPRSLPLSPKCVPLSPTYHHHRLAAEATLSAPPSKTTLYQQFRRHSEPLTAAAEKRKTFTPPSNIPPPEWRLYPSLPASALIAASLFLLGWTAHRGIHWVVPIIAMGLYALSSLIAFTSTTLYVLECYGPKHGESAVAGSMMVVFGFGFAFPLFAEGMYRALGVGLATSLFALIGVVLGLVPGLLCVFGRALRRGARWKEGK